MPRGCAARAAQNLETTIREQAQAAGEHDIMFAVLRSNYGNVLNRQLKLAAAKSVFVDGLRVARALQNQLVVAYLIDGLAGNAVLAGDPAEAAVLMGVADSIFDALGVTSMAAIDKADHDFYLAAIRDQLEHTEVDRLWAQGKRTAVDAVVNRLLGEMESSNSSGYPRGGTTM